MYKSTIAVGGLSGSGKSTVLRLILREARPTSGRVYVAGKEINRLAGWKVPRTHYTAVRCTE